VTIHSLTFNCNYSTGYALSEKKAHSFHLSNSVLGVVSGIKFHDLVLAFFCCYVVYIMLVDFPHLLLICAMRVHTFRFCWLAPHNRII